MSPANRRSITRRTRRIRWSGVREKCLNRVRREVSGTSYLNLFWAGPGQRLRSHRAPLSAGGCWALHLGAWAHGNRTPSRGGTSRSERTFKTNGLSAQGSGAYYLPLELATRLTGEAVWSWLLHKYRHDSTAFDATSDLYW